MTWKFQARTTLVLFLVALLVASTATPVLAVQSLDEHHTDQATADA